MREQGFVWLLLLPVIALLAFGIHQLVHHNEPDSDHVLPTQEYGCTGLGCATPVPEPGSLLMLGAGGLLVGWSVRRRY